jgi:hypothetical protein
MARASKIEKEKRVLQIAEAIIHGYSDMKILEMIKQNWGLTLRQARNYKKWAYEKLKPVNDESIEAKRSAKIAEIQERCRKMNQKELSTAKGLNAWVNAQKLIIKLEDLEPVKKVQISGDEENPLAVKWVEEKTYIKQGEEQIEDE